MTSEALITTILLSIAGLYGAMVAVRIAVILKRIANFRSIIIAMYLVVNVASGVAHLSRLEASNRGYYDLLAQPAGILVATLASVIGLVALCLGCMKGIRRAPQAVAPSPAILRKTAVPLFVVALAMLPLVASALAAIRTYAATLDTERIISLDGGLARLGFLSQWSTWVISFFFLAICATRIARSRLMLGILLLVSCALIVSSLSWTGGRAIAVMMCLPLVLAIWPILGKLRGVLALALSVGALAYSAFLIANRTANYASNNLGLVSAIDWQLGRFSMMGFADEFVSRNGYLLGETFLSGILSVPFGILKLLGLTDGIALPRTITEVTGDHLLGSSSVTFVVPGMSAELYINFGFLGIVLGYYLLGRLVSIVDDAYASTPDMSLKFGLAYVGVLLVFCTVSSQSGAIFSYGLFTGLPVAVLIAWRISAARRERANRSAEYELQTRSHARESERETAP